MTNFTKTFGFAAAAVVMTAGMACAQTTMKADIPFAFQVAGKVMPAGTYSVTTVSRTSAPLLAFQGNGIGALALTTPDRPPEKAWSEDRQARLAFECGSTCTLRQVWNGQSESVYQVSAPKRADVNTRIAVVVMRPDKGD